MRRTSCSQARIAAVTPACPAPAMATSVSYSQLPGRWLGAPASAPARPREPPDPSLSPDLDMPALHHAAFSYVFFDVLRPRRVRTYLLSWPLNAKSRIERTAAPSDTISL